jgi:hypothetical protein
MKEIGVGRRGENNGRKFGKIKLIGAGEKWIRRKGIKDWLSTTFSII